LLMSFWVVDGGAAPPPPPPVLFVLLPQPARTRESTVAGTSAAHLLLTFTIPPSSALMHVRLPRSALEPIDRRSPGDRVPASESDQFLGLGVVAGGRVVGLLAQQRRLFVDAPRGAAGVEGGELRAAGPEPAAGRRIRRAGQVALQQDPPPLPLLARVG